MNERIREELLAMQSEDLRVREELLRANALEFGTGYNPTMESIHRKNAEKLKAVLQELGKWPRRSTVGDDGAGAAWLVLQHAIGEPELQRSCLPLMQEAAACDEIPLWQVAYLQDRIAFFEGRPQLYGTQLFRDDEGLLAVYTLEIPDQVEALRAAVGLPPLADRIELRRTQKPIAIEEVLRDRAEMDVWARSVGWRPRVSE
jgi:hypothetical protein